VPFDIVSLFDILRGLIRSYTNVIKFAVLFSSAVDLHASVVVAVADVVAAVADA
jgi:hypothetical protein